MATIQTQQNTINTDSGTSLVSASIVSQIRKRDGRVVDFSQNKIAQAVMKAFAETGEGGSQEASVIADKVYNDLFEMASSETEFMPTVEGVQDLVEKNLILSEFTETAKAYILYRAKRNEARELEKQKLIDKGSLKVIKRDGSKAIFSESMMKRDFSRMLQGYGSKLNVKKIQRDIVEEVKLNLFDGITTTEINKTIVLALRANIEKDINYSFLASRVLLNDLYKEVIETDEFSKAFTKKYKKSFIGKIKHGVQVGRYDKRLIDFDLEKLSKSLEPKRDKLLNYLGTETLRSRYFMEDYDKNVLELPQYFWMRVAMGLAINEKNKEEKAIEFYDLISTLLYTPSTPTLFQSGTTFPQLSSCYLNTVQDDLNDIFKTYSDNAQLSKYSGGIGTDWTNIRGTGALIKTTNVGSQGVIPFLKIYDATTSAINRSGKRRGAACVYLETWHYDIESFLELRKNTGDERRRTHDTNTANWIPDLFFKRVLMDGRWTLFSPEETPDLHDLYGRAFEDRYRFYESQADKGKIKLYKVLKAKDLWRKMITMLFETGHPWMVFKDACNIRSPQDHVGVVHSSNLCTEITLNTSATETAVCNLGSINIVRHVTNGRLDKKLMSKTINTAMRMLDNVIDVNFYPTKEARNSNLRHRPVGLGIMGLTDTLFEMNLAFDEEKAVEFSDEIMEFISYHAISASCDLAKEKGAYESFKGSKWDRGIFPLDTLTLLEKERGLPSGIKKTKRLDWKGLKAKVRKQGMRNSNTMAIAPTSNLANVTGCVAFSIEPVFKNLFVKSNVVGEFTLLNTYLVDDLKKEGLWTNEMLERIKQTDGSIQNIYEIPQNIRNKYKESFEVDPYWVIQHAAYRAKWIDQSQSLNIFTASTSGTQIADIYLNAWRTGIKSTYYLRTLGASGVEKSTVALSENANASRMKNSNGNHKGFSMDLTEKNNLSTNGTKKKKDKQMLSSQGLVCLIDDGCEVCQ